jgi:5-methylcytosine-specific restriction endonuclease McrA
MELLNRDEFREGVFERDNHKCVICGKPAVDAHHIMERRLFPDGGKFSLKFHKIIVFS